MKGVRQEKRKSWKPNQPQPGKKAVPDHVARAQSEGRKAPYTTHKQKKK